MVAEVKVVGVVIVFVKNVAPVVIGIAIVVVGA